MITHARGFTLIEMMAVLALTGLIALGATVLFNRDGPRDDLLDSVERFVFTAQRISDQAILSRTPMGLVFVPPPWSENIEEQRWAYRWVRSVSLPDENGQLFQQWQTLEGWEPVVLPEGIELFVRLGGENWDWRAVPASDLPVFLLYPSGEADPFLFEVEFASVEPSLDPQNVELDQSGRLQWRQARDQFDALEERFR